MNKKKPIGVLFVCLGNICRSPSSQGIFQHFVDEAGLGDHFDIDSCGTAPFNVGKSPDPRTLKATEQFGYDISQQIARQIQDDDFTRFDYILIMDRKNEMTISGWTPNDYKGEIKLLMEFHPRSAGNKQIPDPYNEGIEAFYPIIETIEQACKGLLKHIQTKHELINV
jgi:protein-tyrosine phosphatase